MPAPPRHGARRNPAVAHRRGSGRTRRRCRPALSWLEDRTLLVASPADPLALVSTPLALGTTTSGRLAVNEALLFRIDPTDDGRLIAHVHAPGGSTRLSLLNTQGQTILTSDGQSSQNSDNLIDVHVAAGTDYLELENIGNAASFTLTTSLTPGSTPFQPIEFFEENPVCIVAADFNGDGKTDLAVASKYSSEIHILLSNGDGTFQEQTSSIAGYTPIAMAVGDFNGDGIPDLAVANEGVIGFDDPSLDVRGDVEVLINQGKGTLVSTAVIPAGLHPMSVVAADFNGDHRTDLAVANYGSDDVTVLINGGGDSFQAPVTNPAGPHPSALAAGDFNGDGRIDLAVANQGVLDADNKFIAGSGSVSIQQGNGDGTFQVQRTCAAGINPTAVLADDFNGDGRTDLAVAEGNLDSVAILLSRGDGTLHDPVVYAAGPDPMALVAGDFNNDGHTDLAVGDKGIVDSTYSSMDTGGVTVLLGNGHGAFMTAATATGGYSAYSLAAGDFDSDGRTDLAVADEPRASILVLLGAGNGTFQAEASSTVPSAVTYPVGSGPSAVAAGDFNGDGIPDLAVANESDGTVSILLGLGDGAFRSQMTYAVGTEPVALVAGDFNGDGRTDLAVANQGQPSSPWLSGYAETYPGDSDQSVGNVVVLLGDGEGMFSSQAPITVGNGPDALVAADFDHDGHLDLAVASENDGTVSVLLGDGIGGFPTQETYTVGSLPSALVGGDFDGDGHTDLAVADSGSSDVSVLLNNGDGTFQSPLQMPLGYTPSSLVAADFNGDGRADLAIANADAKQVSVLLSKGLGAFQDPVTYAVEYASTLVAGDFTGDGRTDLAVAGSDSRGSAVSVLRGNGGGTFLAPVPYVVGSAPDALVAADFTGDGHTDLAIADGQDNDVLVLVGNGKGAFQDQVTYAAYYAVGARPMSLVAGDFNGDGRTDLAIANVNSDDVSVLLGNGDGTFQKAVTYAVGYQPWAIVAGDFNGDGRTDLAVVNMGSYDADGKLDSASDSVSVLLGNGDGTFQAQVTYAGGGENPAALVTGDFNGDGHVDLAIASQNAVDDSSDTLGEGNVSILLGKGDGTFQARQAVVSGITPTNLLAADFNNDGQTDLAIIDADDGNLVVYLNQRDGTFKASPTTLAGVYSAPSLAAGDFNGDGDTDLAIVSNSTGQGQVFLGDGQGSFSSSISFPLVSMDPVALVAGDFNGDGHSDLAIVEQDMNDVAVLLGNGHGTFTSRVTYPTGLGVNALAAADFNGDGRTDLALLDTWSSSTNGGLTTGDVTVLQSTGNGPFDNPGKFATTPRATPLLADLWGNGTDDVLTLDAAGEILDRKGVPGKPDTYQPPVTLNLGDPARDLACIATPLGVVLAAVDVDDNAVTLYAARGGVLQRFGPVACGSMPAQVVAGNLLGDGGSDLVVRNAGDGTLTIIPETRVVDLLSGAFLPSRTFTVAASVGLSDVALVDTTGTGRVDLVVSNKLTGEVSVLSNLGGGVFDTPVTYRAGTGLIVASKEGWLSSRDASAGVVAGAFTSGASVDLLATNPNSNTLGLLASLGDGRFANAVDISTPEPAQVVRVADFNGDGIPDIAVLGSTDVSNFLGNGQGGFAAPVSYNAGLAPTGLSVADANGDGKLDLLIGNEYGDVLVLAGQGDGTFRPLLDSGRNVALAVADLTGRGTRDIVYASQNLDNVVVDYGAGQKAAWGSQSGLLAPGAIAVADLNGDHINDLIVANSGGNNVFVYPGLGNGQFGPALNGGKGFFTGTDPVGITVANLNGRPDLVIADRGSNDVSILLNEPMANDGFTFVSGPRLKTGNGPVSTLVRDVNGDGKPDILVSDSQSNDARLIPGVGGGFFNDQNPTVYPVGISPGPIFLGSFDGTPGLATVNAGSSDVTLVTDLLSSTPTFRTFDAGGTDPVAAFMISLDSHYDSLVVADSGDGHFALLEGGAEGLTVASVQTEPELPNPTALALSALTGGQVDFFAVTAGSERAWSVSLPLTTSNPTTTSEPVASLVPLHDSSLALVATLLIVTTESSPISSTPVAETAAPTVSFLPGSPVLVTQSIPSATEDIYGEDQPPVDPETPASPPSTPAATIWERSLLELEKAMEQLRIEMLDQLPDKPTGGSSSGSTRSEPDGVVPGSADRPDMHTGQTATWFKEPIVGGLCTDRSERRDVESVVAESELEAVTGGRAAHVEQLLMVRPVPLPLQARRGTSPVQIAVSLSLAAFLSAVHLGPLAIRDRARRRRNIRSPRAG